jgi:hypothetical protein
MLRGALAAIVETLVGDPLTIVGILLGAVIVGRLVRRFVKLLVGIEVPPPVPSWIAADKTGSAGVPSSWVGR